MKSITSLILIVLSVGLFLMYIRPEYSTVTGLRAQIASYTDAIANAKQVKTQSDSLLQQYNGISDTDKTKLAAMIPPHFDLIKVISDISTIALQHGMVIKQISSSSGSTGDSSGSRINVIAPGSLPYQTTTVSFTTIGQYINFIAFLKDIEANVELMDVRKIDVNGTVPNLNYTVSLDTYSLQ